MFTAAGRPRPPTRISARLRPASGAGGPGARLPGATTWAFPPVWRRPPPDPPHRLPTKPSPLWLWSARMQRCPRRPGRGPRIAAPEAGSPRVSAGVRRDDCTMRGVHSSPLPQPKSAVADFGHFVEGPNPRYSEVRLGRSRGWGSRDGAHRHRNLATPHSDPPPQGGREKKNDSQDRRQTAPGPR